MFTGDSCHILLHQHPQFNQNRKMLRLLTVGKKETVGETGFIEGVLEECKKKKKSCTTPNSNLISLIFIKYY